MTNIRDIFLKYFGFVVNDIRVLIDNRTTKENIMNRLGWFVADVKAGNTSFFSSHALQYRSPFHRVDYVSFEIESPNLKPKQKNSEILEIRAKNISPTKTTNRKKS